MSLYILQVSGDNKTSGDSSNPFAPADGTLASPSHSGVLQDELEAYLACFGEMNLGPEEDSEPSCCNDNNQLPGPENLEGMVEELRVKLEKSSNILGEPEASAPSVEDLEEVGREGALTCAPDPVPLHIALKNDLQVCIQTTTILNISMNCMPYTAYLCQSFDILVWHVIFSNWQAKCSEG